MTKESDAFAVVKEATWFPSVSAMVITVSAGTERHGVNGGQQGAQCGRLLFFAGAESHGRADAH